MGKRKKGILDIGFNYINIILLGIIGIITIYPLWHELCLSLSSPAQATKGGLFFWPKEFSIAAYKTLLNSNYIWISYRNSAFVTVIGTILSVLVTAMIAYTMSKKNVPGSRVLGTFVLITMIFSGGLIPTYFIVYKLNLINSLWALILINCVSAFNAIVMKNFFASIPSDVEESAFIDGANPVHIFFKIIIPLSLPVIATISLWVSVGLWNDFFAALIYINDRAKHTLPLLLRQIIQQQDAIRQSGEVAESSSESVIGATIIVALIPILSIYPFIQRYFVKGVMVGAVKG